MASFSPDKLLIKQTNDKDDDDLIFFKVGKLALLYHPS